MITFYNGLFLVHHFIIVTAMKFLYSNHSFKNDILKQPRYI